MLSLIQTSFAVLEFIAANLSLTNIMFVRFGNYEIKALVKVCVK